MKILRNIGKIIGSGVFILALTTVAFTIGLRELTEYGILKELVTNLINAQISGDIDKDALVQMHSMFLEECKKSEKIELSNVGGQNVTLDCEDIKKTSPEGLLDIFGNALFDNIYYKKYDCSFIECLQEPGQEKLSVFISLEAHSFFKSLQNILLIVSGMGLVIMLASIETWRNRLKGVGIILLSTALPFFVLTSLKDSVLPIPADVEAVVTPIIDKLLGSISNIFLAMLIAGIVLTAGGYVLQHYRKVKVKGK